MEWTPEKMALCAERIARTGAGRCWHCGELVPAGPTELEEDYANLDPLRLYCVACVPSDKDRHDEAMEVEAFWDLVAPPQRT